MAVAQNFHCILHFLTITMKLLSKNCLFVQISAEVLPDNFGRITTKLTKKRHFCKDQNFFTSGNAVLCFVLSFCLSWSADCSQRYINGDFQKIDQNFQTHCDLNWCNQFEFHGKDLNLYSIQNLLRHDKEESISNVSP